MGRLIILLTDPILLHSPNFGRPKQGQKFVVPTFHIHFLNPECVRIPWVLAPKNFPVENFRVPSVSQKAPFFTDFSCRLQKKVSGSCTHNFDARDLPNSSFEPLYPKLFRGTTEVDLVPIVWHTAPPKVRIPRIHCRRKRLFLGVFLEKKVFLAKRSTFTYSMPYRF